MFWRSYDDGGLMIKKWDDRSDLEIEHSELQVKLEIAKKCIERCKGIAEMVGPNGKINAATQEKDCAEVLAQLEAKVQFSAKVYSCKAVKDEPLDVWKTFYNGHYEKDGTKYCSDWEGWVIGWPKDEDE